MMGQVIASDIKASQNLMKTWTNVNNSKEYTPHFIFFLDCVAQLIKMNAAQFEFTSSYLVHIAFNVFTNKFFETTMPITGLDQGTGKVKLQPDIKLLSMFQANDDKKNPAFVNHVFSTQTVPKSKAPMELDPSKITLWFDYFCRYDEGKKENMSQQVTALDENVQKTTSTADYQKDTQKEIDDILRQLK